MPPLAVLALMLLALPAAAEMYKVVGADGKVTFTDTPPKDASAKSVERFKVESYSGPAQVGVANPDWEAILRRPIAAGTAPRGGLVMFSTETCGYCKKAKRHMAAKGIGYREIDINEDARGREEYKRLGGRGVPFFVVDGRTMAGFSEAALEQLLRGGR